MNINFQSKEEIICEIQEQYKKVYDNRTTKHNTHIKILLNNWKDNPKRTLFCKYLEKYYKLNLTTVIHAHNRNKEKSTTSFKKLKHLGHLLMDMLVFDDILKEQWIVKYCNAFKKEIKNHHDAFDSIPSFYWK
jgi:hypothetical protein